MRSIELSQPYYCNGNKGFSLLELSIVLIIIALLVGGVLAGQNIYKSAQIKETMADLDYYATATKAFQDKYNALPGDMVNATQVWGAINADQATCEATAATDKRTCNGNGNGQIGNIFVVGDAAERFRYWQHLSNAGLIKGFYTGLNGANPFQPPPSGIATFGTNMLYYERAALGSTFLPYDGNILGTGNMTPEQAQEIDNKMDDAKPGYGVIVPYPTTPTCVTTSVRSTAEYSLTNLTTSCFIYYAPNF